MPQISFHELPMPHVLKNMARPRSYFRAIEAAIGWAFIDRYSLSFPRRRSWRLIISPFSACDRAPIHTCFLSPERCNAITHANALALFTYIMPSLREECDAYFHMMMQRVPMLVSMPASICFRPIALLASQPMLICRNYRQKMPRRRSRASRRWGRFISARCLGFSYCRRVAFDIDETLLRYWRYRWYDGLMGFDAHKPRYADDVSLSPWPFAI